MNTRKRQRLPGRQGDSGPPAKKSKAAKTPAKVATRLESLPWKDVAMPDHLDDYEGFFGLDEVEGVEVVRHPETNRVTFNAVPPVAVPDVSEAEAHSDPLDAEEWSGFDDSEGTWGATPKTHSRPKERKAESTSRSVKTNGPCNTSNTSTGGFAAFGLDDEADDGVDVSLWRPLKLSPDTLSALSKLGFVKPTPVQQAAIPEILAGHDVIGKASTGSGKTLAFAIPILEFFLERKTGLSRKNHTQAPVALILSPTRELAHQLDKHITALCSSGSFQAPSVATLTGGLSVQKQQRLIKNADIVIGTPGRLWEVMSQGKGIASALKDIQFLVVDEADRLLSEGNFKEAEEIINALDQEDDADDEEDEEVCEEAEKTDGNAHRQTLVFSATFDRSLQKKLAGKGKQGGALLNKTETMDYLLRKLNFRSETPKFIDANPVHQLAVGLREGVIECSATEKDLYLYTVLLLLHRALPRALVFANSISAVRRLTPFLQNLGLPALALHSGMPQKARLRSIERFKDEKSTISSSSILVATDVAARGLDIPNVNLVVHYHLPRAADTYVHRSGRTARAGLSGASVLICAPEEVAGVRRLVAKVHAHSALHHDTDEAEADEAQKQGHYIRTLEPDRPLVTRLKPRATLAKQIADAERAKQKQGKEDELLRAAAEDLGVDEDDMAILGQGKGKRGRGSDRERKERESSGRSKAEVGAMRGELKRLLSRKINVGVSEKYLTSGRVDVDELLRQRGGGGKGGEFLGHIEGLGGLEALVVR